METHRMNKKWGQLYQPHMYQLNKHSLQDSQSMYMAFGLNRCIWPILICLYCKTEHISISIGISYICQIYAKIPGYLYLVADMWTQIYQQKYLYWKFIIICIILTNIGLPRIDLLNFFNSKLVFFYPYFLQNPLQSITGFHFLLPIP